jgi:hypothetical protein
MQKRIKRVWSYNEISNFAKDEISKITDDELDNKKLSENLYCPISSKLMKDPVILIENGQTYDKESIEEWVKNHDTNPLTNEKLTNKQFVTNFTIKKVVEEWITKHKIKK